MAKRRIGQLAADREEEMSGRAWNRCA